MTGTFTKYGSATTGSLLLDTGGIGLNDNVNTYTKTLALTSSSSIAVGNGTTTANTATTTGTSIAAPTVDQRGAGRSGATDIGAFEYNGGGLNITAPTTQVASITTSSVQYKQFTVGWTAGSGSRRAVFIKQGSTGTAAPVDGTQYATGTTSVWNAGTQIGTSGWYSIYDGVSSTNVTVTGLTPSTNYLVQAFEYNGVGTGQMVYNTATTSANAILAQTYTPITRYVDATSGNDSTGDGTSSTPWKTFTKAYASSSPGDTIDALGTFDWSTSTETSDAAVTGFTIGKDLMIVGHGVDTTIFQASSSLTSVTGRRVFTISANVSTTISNATIRYGYETWDTYSSQAGGGAGINNGGILTLSNSEVTDNYAAACSYCSTAGYGGGLYNYATTTITNSSFYNNKAYWAGGGVSNGGASSTMIMTNSTIYNNSLIGDTASSNYGGGVGLVNGTSTIVNCTIAFNTGKNGGGIYTSGAATRLYIMNTIVATNTATTTAYHNVYRSAGTITSGGYNIIGTSTSFTTTTGDWYITGSPVTYKLTASSTTGITSLDTSAGLNSTLNGSRTYAVTASTGIPVNNGTSTSINSVSAPATDQRGALRNGATDIGAYEYEGTFDLSYYTVNYVAGANGSITGSSTQYVASGSSTSAVVAVPNTGYSFVNWSDASTSATRLDSNVSSNLTLTANFATTTYLITYTAGSGGSITGSSTQQVNYGSSTTEVTATPSTNYLFSSWSDGVSSASRSESNVTSSLSVTANFSLLGAPVITAATSSPSASSATITWTTDISASSKVVYGPTASYGNTTEETDTVSRVTSHSVSLSSLTSCAIYHFKAVSGNIYSSYSTSSDYSFITSGCIGSSSVTTSTVAAASSVATTTVWMDNAGASGSASGSGGSTVSTSGGGITVVMPANYASTTANIQIKKLVESSVASAAGTPSGYSQAGDKVYSLTAITDALYSITSFDETLTMTMTYSDSDVSGIDESTLKIFHWSGSAWDALLNCVVDTSAQTVTCDTDHFSTFGLFGEAVAAAASSGVVGAIMAPPAPPIVVNVPRVSGSKIVSDARNVFQIAVSDKTDFAGASWELYSAGYDISRLAGNTLYVKFRSQGGGESPVYAVSKSAPAAAKDSAALAVDGANFQFKRDLKLGSSHADVKQLQKFLNANGFIVSKSGAGSPGRETSYFGAATRNALIKFQKARGIKPANGLFGPITRGAANE